MEPVERPKATAPPAPTTAPPAPTIDRTDRKSGSSPLVILASIGLLMLVLIFRESSLVLFWLVSLLVIVVDVSRWIDKKSSPLPGIITDLGFVMNLAAVAANGFMPVLGKGADSRLHRYMTIDRMRLAYLCDIHKGFSLGDMVIGVGMLVTVLFWGVRKWRGLHASIHSVSDQA